MEIRRIRPDEGFALRDLRLRALGEAPEAFGTTLAEMQTQPLRSHPWLSLIEMAKHLP